MKKNAPENVVPNEKVFFNADVSKLLQKRAWFKENTAILIVHGIGDQVPLATLDEFARGLITAFQSVGLHLQLNHVLMPKADGDKIWYDNVLRISRQDADANEAYLDIYEYYWANYTQDKASWSDLNQWLNGVVDGAQKFYKRNETLGKIYKDRSIFFDSKGRFNKLIYRFFIAFAAKLLMILDITATGLLKLLTYIPLPFIGELAAKLLNGLFGTFIHRLTNTVGDVTVYNVVDPKSKFYCVRKQISEGCVTAIQYLIDKTVGSTTVSALRDDLIERRITPSEYEQALLKLEPQYPRVLIAGHSLGSQIAYDGINKINFMVNQAALETYDQTGFSRLKPQNHVSEQLKGFITFGSPLDKIVFFLRENVPDEQYIRRQMLKNFLGFKMHDTDLIAIEDSQHRTGSTLVRMFEDITWRNYFDRHDYVSGGLDYFTKVVNVDCNFKKGWNSFTHSDYWSCNDFYLDIIDHYLA